MTLLFELHAIKEKSGKKRKPNHLKNSGQYPLPKKLFKQKMQPEANDANRKTVSRPALRADGSLLDFSISWLLHKQGDLWLGAACSVTAAPLWGLGPFSVHFVWSGSSLRFGQCWVTVPCHPASVIPHGDPPRGHGLLGPFYGKGRTDTVRVSLSLPLGQ